MRDRPSDAHRRQTERELGRKLATDEVVDHADTDKSNNNRANRRVMSRSEHSRHHTDPAVRALAKLQKALGMARRGEKLF